LSAEQTPDAGRALDARGLWFFAAAALPTAMLNVPLAAYLPPFYAQKVGLSLATIGLIFMAARIWDVITDPLMGALTDRTHGRWGRRRPWMVASAPILMLSIWALFFPPAGAGTLWLVVALFAVTAANTMLSITHAAWSADAAATYHERSRVQAAMLMVTIGGSLAAMLLPALFEGHVADPVTLRAHLLGGLVILLVIPTVGLSLLSGREPPTAPHEGPVTNPFVAIYQALRRQPFLAKLLFADFVQGVSGGVLGGLSYYMALAKGVGERSSLLILCFYVAGVLVVPVWIKVSYRLGKTRTIGWSSLLSILLILLVVAAPSGNLPLLCGAFGLFGTTMGVWLFLIKSIVADRIEIEEKAVGEPRAGMIFALFVLTQKMGGALAVGVSYLALNATGYRPGAALLPNQAVAVLAMVAGSVIFGHMVMAWVAFRGEGGLDGQPPENPARP
jgi:Na+/melibiose symporter-like transporter